jgi:hypothetical protein
VPDLPKDVSEKILLQKEIENLRAENQRLREALEEVTEVDYIETETDDGEKETWLNLKEIEYLVEQTLQVEGE